MSPRWRLQVTRTVPPCGENERALSIRLLITWPSRESCPSTEKRPLPSNFIVTTVPSDRKSTRLNSSHSQISYAVFCLQKKKLRGPSGHGLHLATLAAAVVFGSIS